ncbi:MAG: D-alanyl-D-alanine carboxypeptidase [Oscillospiraceae bacterium]|jgi:D-alanyl-D-alanine carboxypeptidase|nr:D-alanyl-D-alanine carboxypeptidase [Oscillospiraceae bacterium]
MTLTSEHNRLIAAALAAVCLFSSTLSAYGTASPPKESSYTAVVYDADTFETLYDDDGDLERSIASVTKIMTAIVALERVSLNKKVTFKQEWKVEGSGSGFIPGKDYTARQLIYALMLLSGNDAAVGLAEITAGSVAEFAELMNAKASELGLTHTNFKNPHGLDETGHYSSAKDLAVLTAYAMRNSKFSLIVSTREANVGGVYFKNHNKLLWYGKGVIGVKTGFTEKSGRTLVSAAVRNGRTIIIVTLNDPNDWNDHVSLYDWAFGSDE